MVLHNWKWKIRGLTFVFGFLVAFVSLACGQRQDTIYQTLASNYVSSNVNGDTWGPITNIGQGYHQAYLNVSAQPTHTCNSGSATAGIVTTVTFEVQPPGQSIFPVPTSQVNVTAIGGSGASIIASATNIFPFVYVNVTGVDIVNCQYTLIYSGSLYPTVAPVPGVCSTNSIIAPANCNYLGQYNHITTTSGPGNVIISNTTFAGYNEFDVTGLVISNTTAAQTVTIFCGTQQMGIFANLIAGQTVTLPIVSNNYWYACTNNNIIATLANATPVDINTYIVRR